MSTEQKTDQTITDKTREFFKSKLTSGYPVPTDKPTATIFVKDALSTLGLSKGHTTKTKAILKEVLDEMKIDTNTMGFAKSISNQFHFIKDEIPEPPKQQPQEQPKKEEIPIQQQTKEEKKPQEPLPEIFKQRYHRDLGSISKWIHDLTVKHGVRKPEPAGQKPEIIQLGEDWADYLYESGIKLPRALGFTFLILRTLVSVIFPVFKFMFRKKATEQKASAQLPETKK